MGGDPAGPALTLLVHQSADVDSQPLVISVLPSDRAQRIKELIEPLLNIPVALQKLKSGGRILKDGQRVCDYSVVLKPGASVWVHQIDVPLVRCPTPGCNCEMKPGRIEAHLLRCPALAEKHALLACGYCSPAVNTGGGDELEAKLDGVAPFDEREFSARVLRAHAAAGAIAICEEETAICGEQAGGAVAESAAAGGGGGAVVPTGVSPPTAEAGAAVSAAALGAGRKGQESHGAGRKGQERHQEQREAIAARVEAMGSVLSRGHTLVEYGAGNGELALTVMLRAQAQVAREAAAGDQAAELGSVVLVDSAKSPAKNADGKLRALTRGTTSALAPPTRTVGGGATHRARIGLEDLDLRSLAEQVAPGRRAVVVAKHLCGAATDYALRSAVASRAAGAPPVAVVLSTCCHHRCTYQAYPNRPFLARLGLSGRTDFGMLCRAASWYIDGRHTVDDSTAGARARVGASAKALLDEGRAEYLRAHGFDDATLCRFVDAAVSPENMLLVASCPL